MPVTFRPHVFVYFAGVVIAFAWLSAGSLASEPAEDGAIQVGAKQAAPDEVGSDLFERKIRPLLDQHCSSCHGQQRQKGGLNLASRETMLAGGEGGVVVVPGKPEESPLIEAVGYEGAVQMPPSGRLSAGEIAALRQWVELGAPWPASPAATMRSAGEITDADRGFWSFRPVGSFPPPAVRQAAWPRQPLDAFVLARLEAEELEPVGQADRRTLIRRATFDLTGLPPTAEEVETFVADERPDAYEQLLDRLLDSPHYGERWARHWLDVARFGEDQAHTFQARLYPSGYRYRDWVVEAFNRDLPFDRFVMEQIAGDLLPDAPGGSDRTGRLAALGFFALGPVYYADNACAMKAKTDEYDDRIDTLARGFLGLTVACARCHDHKFDPISMRDYYGLAGIVASSDYWEAPLAPSDVVERYDAAQAKIKEAEEELKEAHRLEARRQGESLAPETVGYLVAVWKFDNRRKTEPEIKLAAAAQEAGLPEAVLERWRAHLTADAEARHPLLASWREMLATQDAAKDLSSDAEALAAAERAAASIQAILMAAINQRRTAEEQLAAVASKESQPRPAKPEIENSAADILRYFVDDRSAPLALPKELVEKLLPDDRKQLLAAKQTQVEELKKAAGEKYPVAHSLREGKPADMRIHRRGSPTDLGDEAPRGFLRIISAPDAQPFEQGSGRLELARAIADPANPLTARVFVNRVWQQHFGRGIVGTPSNFGLLGERPTHPELLDHLASRFVASGWSVKQLHREIMLSATYRLASSFNAANYERHPDNRLLWRMNRRRLDVEAWRDALLAACGNLDATMGGPSLKLDDPNNRRRTLYAAVSRHELNPMLRLFDFPDPNLTSERRVITTVPMQQLFVLNSDFMVRQAKALAARLASHPAADDDHRIEQAYRWVFGRAPHERERQFVQEFLGSAGSAPTEKLTSWEQLAQALLASNEFVFID
jgi:mono/diheme cytochrome c family protein